MSDQKDRLLPSRYCSGCGVMPADVTHICPPIATPTAPLTCTYAEPEWYCIKRSGHDGDHEGPAL